MIGILLAHNHLYGHKGLPRMLANLEGYHFKSKYTLTRKFIGACYGCFLSQTANRHVKLGTYPIPEHPFSDVMLDICENLNNIKGYQHLLLIQCLLTDFVIIIPLRTKKAAEIEHMLMISLLQQRNVKRIISDNGPGFRSLPHLSILAALHIQVVATASLSPIGRGKIERLVGITKIMMRRILATRPSYNWAYIPMIVAIAINTTVSPRTGFKPCVMVGGSEQTGLTFMDLDGLAPLHFMIKNDQMHVEELHKDLQKSLRIARERLQEIQNIRHEQLNKHKINNDINVNDYVFVLDRAKVPGSARPLKTKLQCTPYIVISVRHTSSVVRRLSDGFTALYSHNHIKKYKGGNPFFKDLPQEVKNILVNKFSDLLADDLTTIARHDPMEVPDAIQLMDLESGEPVKESGRDSKLAEISEEKPLSDENEINNYLNDIERNDILQDLKGLQDENPKAKSQKLFNQAELGSDSEDELNEDNNAWAQRLRPRNGKTVRFK
jgi:predicted transcriptional regulator